MAALIDSEELLAEELGASPEFRERWENTALARAVALATVRHRAQHGLTQTRLARQLGMRQPQVARLEMGEHNPSVEMLQRLATGLGLRFILAVAPADQMGDLVLPPGVEVLQDLTTSKGGRVLAAAGYAGLD